MDRYMDELMHEYMDTLIHGHTSSLMHGHTDARTHWYTYTLMDRYTDEPIQEYTDTLIHRHNYTRTYWYTDALIHEHTDTRTHWYTDTLVYIINNYCFTLVCQSLSPMYILMGFFLSVLYFILETFLDEWDTIWTYCIELIAYTNKLEHHACFY